MGLGSFAISARSVRRAHYDLASFSDRVVGWVLGFIDDVASERHGRGDRATGRRAVVALCDHILALGFAHIWIRPLHLSVGLIASPSTCGPWWLNMAFNRTPGYASFHAGTGGRAPVNLIVRRQAMNVGVEFHDSRIRQVEHLRDRVRVSFDSAYVHRSSGRPGIDPGEGHVQAAELVFGGAQCEPIGADCHGPLSDGEVSVDGVAYCLLPAPFQSEGAVIAQFVFCTGAVLRLTAKSVSLVLHGASRFVETHAA